MNKILDSYNRCVGALVALLSGIFGVYWYVFAAYAVLNILDWITGWCKAVKAKDVSSAEGLKGIIKKLGYWVIITVAFLVSYVLVEMGEGLLGVDLSFLTMVGWFTLASLTINEVRSITENLLECGCKIPQVLIKGLSVAQKLINEED